MFCQNIQVLQNFLLYYKPSLIDNDSSASAIKPNSLAKLSSKKPYENLKNAPKYSQAESSSAFNCMSEYFNMYINTFHYLLTSKINLVSQGLHNVSSPTSPYLESLRNLSLNDNLNTRNIDRKGKGKTDYRTTIVEEFNDYSDNR